MSTYTTENKGYILKGSPHGNTGRLFQATGSKTSPTSPFTFKPIAFHNRFADYLLGVSGGVESNDPRAFMSVYWSRILDTGVFWCASAPNDFPNAEGRDFMGWNWGVPIAVNGHMAPITNHGQGLESERVDEISDLSTAIVAADGHELGLRKGGWREIPGSAYWGEYADPLFRHFAQDDVPERTDLAVKEAQGENVSGVSGGLGRGNFAMWDGSVQGIEEQEFIDLIVDDQLQQQY
jgi:prepilin-type processing-associated H-X9-DG protein